MPRDVLIAGMWGTTHLQLMLLEAGARGLPRIVESRRGPGAAELQRSGFEGVLLDLTEDWRHANPGVQVHLAGMVGSTIGWIDVDYDNCPAAPLRKVMSQQVSGVQVRIVGGMRCINCLGEIDLMRGEETEAAGWLALAATDAAQQHVLVVPGTHTKWIRVARGVVEDFLTSVTGECYAGFADRGILLPQPPAAGACDGQAFRDGVRAALAPGFSLLHSLFSVRSRQVAGGASATDAAQRLSGLLVGSDVAGAIDLLALREAGAALTVIGTPALAARYQAALHEAGIRSETMTSLDASAAGLWSLRGSSGVTPA